MHLRNPPAHGHPDDNDEERPLFVLIEQHAYFTDRDNATTATCEISGFAGTFKVTFCTARPPLVSYFCFHATAYNHTDYADIEPHILATETDGGLVLLRVVFGDNLSLMNSSHYGEYLVYDASGPSLKHLPTPHGILFSDESVAFVRKSTGDGAGRDYVLAAHSGVFGYGERSQLYLYHSDTDTWITKPLTVKKPFSDPDPDLHPYHSTCKAITIGGSQGIVAWVDLWHNIILCNVLSNRPKLHSLELPAAIMSWDDKSQNGDPSSVRDIAILSGLFKFVEMQFHVAQPGSHSLDNWEAKVWSTKLSSSSAKDWHVDYQVRSSDIQSLPMLRVEPGRAQPTLSTLHTGLPNLSLQDNGIVYFLSKVYYCNNDHVAWVLAVDVRNKTIQRVEEFRPTRTLGLAQGYTASRISKYLRGTKQN